MVLDHEEVPSFKVKAWIGWRVLSGAGLLDTLLYSASLARSV